jgi:hypothetical protein
MAGCYLCQEGYSMVKINENYMGCRKVSSLKL